VSSERNPERQECEDAMEVAQRAGLLSEPELYARFGVLQRKKCQKTFRGPASTPVCWLERGRDGGFGWVLVELESGHIPGW